MPIRYIMMPLWWIRTNYIFSHYFLTMAIAFLGIAAMLRDQVLAIAGVECKIFLFKINWNGLNVFTLISMVKNAS